MIQADTTSAAQLVPGKPFGEYLDIDAVNASLLCNFCRRSDKAARYAMLHPKQTTAEMVTGHAVHAAILEPEFFAAHYAYMPKFGDERFKVTKEKKAAWEAEHQNAIQIDTDTAIAAQKLIESIKESRVLTDLVYGQGLNELTVLFKDETTGRACKARVDRITNDHGWPVLMDLKTIRSLDERQRISNFSDLSYDVRMAWYVDALNRVKPCNWKVAILWLCTEAPYEVTFQELSDDIIEEGRAAYRSYLDRYHNCMTTGIWAGVPAQSDILTLPRWAYRFTQPKEIQ